MQIEKITYDKHVTAAIITDKPLKKIKNKLVHNTLEDLPTTDGYVIIPDHEGLNTKWLTYAYKDKRVQFDQSYTDEKKADSNTLHFAYKLYELYSN